MNSISFLHPFLRGLVYIGTPREEKGTDVRWGLLNIETVLVFHIDRLDFYTNLGQLLYGKLK